jgi:hypothetical protein
MDQVVGQALAAFKRLGARHSTPALAPDPALAPAD